MGSETWMTIRERFGAVCPQPAQQGVRTIRRGVELPLFARGASRMALSHDVALEFRVAWWLEPLGCCRTLAACFILTDQAFRCPMPQRAGGVLTVRTPPTSEELATGKKRGLSRSTIYGARQRIRASIARAFGSWRNTIASYRSRCFSVVFLTETYSSAKTSRTVALSVVMALANGTTVRAVVVLLTMAEHGAIYRSKSSGISSTFWYSTTLPSNPPRINLRSPPINPFPEGIDPSLSRHDVNFTPSR